MYHVPFALQYIYGHTIERDENGDGEEGREWRLPSVLHADDFVLYGESEEDLRVQVRAR